METGPSDRQSWSEDIAPGTQHSKGLQSEEGGLIWGLMWVSGLPVVVEDCSLVQGEQLSLRGCRHALIGSG